MYYVKAKYNFRLIKAAKKQYVEINSIFSLLLW